MKIKPTMLPAVLLLALIPVIAVSAENRVNTYRDLLAGGEMEKLKLYLEDWQSESPEDPEMFIGWFNYYLNLDSVSTPSMFRDPWTGRHIMAPRTEYVPGNVRKAIEYLDNGLKIAPDRLDMHLGKIRALSEIHEYELQARLLSRLIADSSEPGRIWLWSVNTEFVGPEEDQTEALMYSIQDYIMFWRNIGTEESMSALRFLGEQEIRLYPDSVLGYSNTALFYLETEQYPQALKVLLAAYKKFPDDYIIIHNIGNCYKELGNGPEAVSFYKMLYDFPEIMEKDYVDGLIKGLEE